MEKTYNISFLSTRTAKLDKEVRYYLEEGGLWLACPKLKMNVGEADYKVHNVIKLSALTGK